MKKNIQMVRITVKAVIAGILLVVLSCSDFLDKQPQGQLTQESIPYNRVGCLAGYQRHV